jgi:hypothetical protein
MMSFINLYVIAHTLYNIMSFIGSFYYMHILCVDIIPLICKTSHLMVITFAITYHYII